MRRVTCIFQAVVCVLCLLAARPSVWAHDLWLVPDADPVAGKPLWVRANSGMDFPRSVHAPDVSKFSRRIVIRPDGREGPLDAAGQDGLSSLLRFEPAAAGVSIVAVETPVRQITLEADQFNEYLVADGLPQIYRLRAKEKTLNEPGREQYSKSPKALVRVGQGGAGDPCRPVGLPLEIVPLRDPFALNVGDTLRVRVLFRGQPLPDANLGWDLPDDGEAPSGTTRTDSRGEALLPIARTGLVTIRLTHMTRPKTADFEWESFWTTLTWRVPGTEAK